MDRIAFTTTTGARHLRPTHARLVAARLGSALQQEECGLSADAADVARAALQVRDAYRCRTVRTELRNLALLAEAGTGFIMVSCADPAEIDAMRKARET